MKLGPLFISIEGLILTKNDRKNLSSDNVGGVILFSRNYENKKQLKELINDIKNIKSPELIISVDQEGGRIQRFENEFSSLPSLGSIGEMYEDSFPKALECAFLAGGVMAIELSECGVDFSFAPVLDIDHGCSEIIGDRSFHSDYKVVSILAEAYVLGTKTQGMISVGKHFPGHGGVVLDSHEEMPIDERSIEDLNNDLGPYRFLSETHLNAIMTAHIQYPNIDENIVTFSEYWLKTILREELGFRGLVFSDDLMMKAIDEKLSIEQKIHKAIFAGCDFILICNVESTDMSILLENLELDYDNVAMGKKYDALRCKRNTVPSGEAPLTYCYKRFLAHSLTMINKEERKKVIKQIEKNQPNVKINDWLNS